MEEHYNRECHTNSRPHSSLAACMIRMAAVSYRLSHILSVRCLLQVIVILNQKSKEYFISPCHYEETGGLDVKTDFLILPIISEALHSTAFQELTLTCKILQVVSLKFKKVFITTFKKYH